jgi:hypothetical protein
MGLQEAGNDARRDKQWLEKCQSRKGQSCYVDIVLPHNPRVKWHQDLGFIVLPQEQQVPTSATHLRSAGHALLSWPGWKNVSQIIDLKYFSANRQTKKGALAIRVRWTASQILRSFNTCCIQLFSSNSREISSHLQHLSKDLTNACNGVHGHHWTQVQWPYYPVITNSRFSEKRVLEKRFLFRIAWSFGVRMSGYALLMNSTSFRNEATPFSRS